MSEDTRHADAADKRSIAFECDLPEAPEKVWQALTTPEVVSEWLLPTDLQPEIGKKFGFRDPAAKDEPIECEILDVEPLRSIRFSWRDAEARRDWLDSTVTFEIAATEAGGTHLTIVHEVRYAAAVPQRAATMAVNDNGAMSMRLAA
jgi:uncharacterized protein YndB with AHSA1/START domain